MKPENGHSQNRLLTTAEIRGDFPQRGPPSSLVGVCAFRPGSDYGEFSVWLLDLLNGRRRRILQFEGGDHHINLVRGNVGFSIYSVRHNCFLVVMVVATLKLENPPPTTVQK